jgi:hypothetical protein
MAPFYRGFETKPKLNEDDIKAIQVDKLVSLNKEALLKGKARYC